MTVTRTGLVHVGTDGAVFGSPRRWLQAEAFVLFVGSLVDFRATHGSWWLLVLLFLAPDLSAAGFAINNRIGARLYNLSHALPLPASLVFIGWASGNRTVVLIGLIGFAHIGMDRLLGFGLKYGDNPRHTHLGRMGGAHKN